MNSSILLPSAFLSYYAINVVDCGSNKFIFLHLIIQMKFNSFSSTFIFIPQIILYHLYLLLFLSLPHFFSRFIFKYLLKNSKFHFSHLILSLHSQSSSSPTSQLISPSKEHNAHSFSMKQNTREKDQNLLKINLGDASRIWALTHQELEWSRYEPFYMCPFPGHSLEFLHFSELRYFIISFLLLLTKPIKNV